MNGSNNDFLEFTTVAPDKVYLNSESPYTPLLGVCPDLLLKLLKLNIIEVGTKSP